MGIVRYYSDPIRLPISNENNGNVFLAISAATVPSIFPTTSARNALDVALLKKMDGVMSDQDREELHMAVQRFFTCKIEVKQEEMACAAEHRPAVYAMKSKKHLENAWEEIFRRRRTREPNDRQPMSEKVACTDVYAAWLKEWVERPGNLTPEQQRKPWNKITSAFNAYLNNNFGGKVFVMAMWQSGMSWAPSCEQLASDYDGAVEHIAKNFAAWIRRFARSLRKHKEDPLHVAAKQRSGGSSGRHGPTREQEDQRSALS